VSLYEQCSTAADAMLGHPHSTLCH